MRFLREDTMRGAFDTADDSRAVIRGLVAQALAARADVDAFLSFFHDDAVFHMTGGVADFSFAGVYAGKSAIRAMLQRIDVEVEFSDARILQLLITDDRIALLRGAKARHRGTAAQIDLVASNFIRFKDLKVCEIHEHFDTGSYAALAGDA